MDVPGFDVYAFPERPDVLYAIKEFRVGAPGGDLTVVVELLLRGGCRHALVRQGNAKKPKFLVRNNAEGLPRPVGSSIAKELRKVLFSKPAGDTLEGCAEAVADVSGAFDSLPRPRASVLARVPVVVVGELEFENKLGSRDGVHRAVFELKPQHYAYVVATEHGVRRMTEKFGARIKALSP